MQSSLTPLMGKKTQISSYSHHENATTPMSGKIRYKTYFNKKKVKIKVDIIFTETGSANSKMSTFSSGCTKNNVQMRRTTNKKGKTAPAPPKRTRYKFDWNSIS